MSKRILTEDEIMSTGYADPVFVHRLILDHRRMSEAIRGRIHVAHDVCCWTKDRQLPFKCTPENCVWTDLQRPKRQEVSE